MNTKDNLQNNVVVVRDRTVSFLQASVVPHNIFCQDRMLCSVFCTTNLTKICRKPDTPSLSQRTNQACMVEKQLYAAPGNRNRAKTKFKELL
jgi:hypothetical protein